jgi:hypothetical protein
MHATVALAYNWDVFEGCDNALPSPACAFTPSRPNPSAGVQRTTPLVFSRGLNFIEVNEFMKQFELLSVED